MDSLCTTTRISVDNRHACLADFMTRTIEEVAEVHKLPVEIVSDIITEYESRKEFLLTYAKGQA